MAGAVIVHCAPFASSRVVYLQRVLLQGSLHAGSVVQTLDVIRDLCPGDPAFDAHEVPLDAMMAEMLG